MPGLARFSAVLVGVLMIAFFASMPCFAVPTIEWQKTVGGSWDVFHVASNIADTYPLRVIFGNYIYESYQGPSNQAMGQLLAIGPTGDVPEMDIVEVSINLIFMVKCITY